MSKLYIVVRNQTDDACISIWIHGPYIISYYTGPGYHLQMKVYIAVCLYYYPKSTFVYAFISSFELFSSYTSDTQIGVVGVVKKSF